MEDFPRPIIPVFKKVTAYWKRKQKTIPFKGNKAFCDAKIKKNG